MLDLRTQYPLALLPLIAALGCMDASDTEPSDGARSFDSELSERAAQAPALAGRVPSPEALASAADEALGGAESALENVQYARVTRLPGQKARKVVHDSVDEAENLFFTEDGRLFVSGGEDIFEITRSDDGTFTHTDYFHEDCVVEGIVQNGAYLYGVCWTLGIDLTIRSYLLGGEITARPAFRILGELVTGVVANGMAVDPEGRVYITYTSSGGEIARLTFDRPLELSKKEIWARDLPNVNGIKYQDGAFYVTTLNPTLVAEFLRVPVLADGSAGKPKSLFRRAITVLDDVMPFDGGWVISDFLKGTLIFWDSRRGVYAETPRGTFYGPTALAVGRPPMFTERQLLVPEKGNFLIRGEKNGDSLSVYQLPN